MDANWREFRQAFRRAEDERRAVRDFSTALSREFQSLTEGIRSGAEDPVLIRLLGPQFAALVHKVGWSSLVLNPGSTSTKVAVYHGLNLLGQEELPRRDAGDGLDARVEQVVDWLVSQGLALQEISGIAARGGLMAPVPSGTFRVSPLMVEDLEHSPYPHASNLAVPMALRLGAMTGQDPVITTSDPVMVDEIEPVYRLTGSARIRNDGTAVHYLNQRAVAELTAGLLGVRRAELHLVTCHLGGGVSAVRHQDGRMVQVSQAFGAMPSANRSGSLPLQHILRLMESHEYTLDDLRSDVVSEGGLVALAGTDSFKQVMAFAEQGASPEQREKLSLVLAWFANRVAAGILELCATPRPVELVVLTGGLARSEAFCASVADRLPLRSPVARLPGSVEQSALAAGLLSACAEPGTHRLYTEAREATAENRARVERLLDVTIFDRQPRGGTGPRAPRRLNEIVQAAGADDPPTIALVGADNEEALLAVKQASELGPTPMARFLLLGPYGPVSQLAWELDVPIDEQTTLIVDSPNPVERAAELLRAGVADTLMKGSVGTADVLKGYLGYLKAAGLMRPELRLSHLGLFEIPGRPKLVAVTDAAMNTYPDVEARVAILENALRALHLLGFDRPRVAVVSAVEKPSKAVTSSLEGQAIAERFRARTDLIIEGPLSVDLALSPESAREKRYRGQIQGDADLLLVPDIDTGNAVYKVFTVASGATTAGAIIGGRMPLILTSRGDSARSKLSSIALAVLLTQKAKRAVEGH